MGSGRIIPLIVSDPYFSVRSPAAQYLETTTRYPFGDWYETVTGEYCHFKGRSVQGGIFMPLFMEKMMKII